MKMNGAAYGRRAKAGSEGLEANTCGFDRDSTLNFLGHLGFDIFGVSADALELASVSGATSSFFSKAASTVAASNPLGGVRIVMASGLTDIMSPGLRRVFGSLSYKE